MSTARKSPEVKGAIWEFLKLGWSFSQIIKHFKQINVNISKGLISKIKNNQENNSSIANHGNYRGRKPKLNKDQMKKLKKMVENPNPRPQRVMANLLNVSPRVINYQIHKVLNKKKVNKPKVHALTQKMKEKRYKRSWSFYNMLKKDKWKRFITSDEACFYLSEKNGKTSFQYLSRGQTRNDCEALTHVSHPKGFMVWLGISANGCTKLRFVEPGVKINSVYYQQKIIKPFIEEDLPKLYPDGEYLFHQDSAPSHTSKSTINYHNQMNVKFIPPDKWLPNSPDAAPLDYFVWGYLKNKINKHKVRTLNGLKKALKEEATKMPQYMIDHALSSWSKRCRRIYYNKGNQIEKYCFPK